eukprot:UN02834
MHIWNSLFNPMHVLDRIIAIKCYERDIAKFLILDLLRVNILGLCSDRIISRVF